MSAGYAERLKEYPNKGKCGLPENYDTPRSLSSKIATLATLLHQSSYTVVLTGAGISTSAGIPDFRGPNGIWTREEQRKKKMKRKRGVAGNETDNNTNNENDQSEQKNEEQQKNIQSSPSLFVTAKPTLTHRALAHLITTATTNNNPEDQKRRKNNHHHHYIQHVITQNIDGLHGKSSIPRSQLSILHGDIFTEKCSKCNQEYIRNYEISTIGLQPTGRHCDVVLVGGNNNNPPGSSSYCNGPLIDTLLDWEDALPEYDWSASQVECAKSNLILCLGTSLRIEPAGGLCLLGTSEGFVDAGAADWDLDDDDIRSSSSSSSSSSAVQQQQQHTTTKKSKSKKEGITKKKKKKKRRQPPPKKLGYVIVNLQETPYDDNATLVIRARVDDVMERLMTKLGYGSDWDSSNNDE